MSDRDLLEKLLTAQVLTLTEVIMMANKQAVGRRTGHEYANAVALIRQHQAAIIAKLTDGQPPAASASD